MWVWVVGVAVVEAHPCACGWVGVRSGVGGWVGWKRQLVLLRGALPTASVCVCTCCVSACV